MFLPLPGEKLSKQQLHSSNIIKKLRAKDKENENIIAKLKKKVKELEEELQHLKQVNVNHCLHINCYYLLYEQLAIVYKTFGMTYWGISHGKDFFHNLINEY